MKAIITGVTGFAGSHLAEYLLSRGDEVLGCSRRGAWPSATPTTVAETVPLLRWDITTHAGNDIRRELVAFQADFVFHLAGISVPAQCGDTEPTAEAVAANVEGVRNVLEVVSEFDGLPRVLFTSSGRVYGPDDVRDRCVSETPWVHPLSAYGKTKLAAEWLAREMIETHGVDVIIARAFNHAGPRQMPPLMLAQWCDQLIRQERPLTIANDNTYMDLSDVRDVVRAYRLLAELGETATTYNVGSGQSRQTGEIARRLVRHAARDWPIESLSKKEQHNPIAKIDKLKSLTRWRPEIPLEKTIRDTWRFWVERAATSS